MNVAVTHPSSLSVDMCLLLASLLAVGAVADNKLIHVPKVLCSVAIKKI